VNAPDTASPKVKAPKHPPHYCGNCINGYYLRPPRAVGWKRVPDKDQHLDLPDFGLVWGEAWITNGGALYLAPLDSAIVIREMCNCLRAYNGLDYDLVSNQDTTRALMPRGARMPRLCSECGTCRTIINLDVCERCFDLQTAEAYTASNQLRAPKARNH